MMSPNGKNDVSEGFAIRPSGFVILALGFCFLAGPLAGQELEPRAYAPAPVGANIAIVAYGYQSGEVLFDPSLPFSDVKAYIHGAVPGFARSFDLAGRYASVAVAVPYVWASVGGNVGEQHEEITRSGLGDMRLRFVVNLLGAPALPPQAWLARKPTTSLGFSLVVQGPTGQYSSEKLINIGGNRWAAKPEFGLSYPVGRWTLEAAAGVWLFTDNTAAYPGTVVRSQDPLYSFQGHVGYTVRPGLWVAADATYYAGGKTYSNDVPGDTRQANSRAGLTASVPVARGHAVKVSASRGVDARIGSRFDSYGIAYQFVWFDK
jgi:hypothetical protein